MVSSTVRISREAQDALRELADEEGESMQRVLEKAIEDYRRKRFFESVNQAYAALRKDKKAWVEELRERHEWDATLSDGLGDD